MHSLNWAASKSAAGGAETIKFNVYDASSGVTYENIGARAVITPGATAGGYADPILIKMDSVAPVLTLKGEASLKIDQGTTYVDAGASATDNVYINQFYACFYWVVLPQISVHYLSELSADRSLGHQADGSA